MKQNILHYIFYYEKDTDVKKSIEEKSTHIEYLYILL